MPGPQQADGELPGKAAAHLEAALCSTSSPRGQTGKSSLLLLCEGSTELCFSCATYIPLKVQFFEV